MVNIRFVPAMYEGDHFQLPSGDNRPSFCVIIQSWQCWYWRLTWGIEKNSQWKKLPPVRIQLGISCVPVWCSAVWVNLASVLWGNFCWCTNWLLNLDDLDKINRAWLYKDLKSQSCNQYQVNSNRTTSDWNPRGPQFYHHWRLQTSFLLPTI